MVSFSNCFNGACRDGSGVEAFERDGEQSLNPQKLM